jgi:hypothetical protein
MSSASGPAFNRRRRPGYASDAYHRVLSASKPRWPRRLVDCKARPPVDDPIFAEIENHKNLDKGWLDLLRAGAPQRDVDRASDAEEKAPWKIARTTPTTAAGAAGLLEYIAVGPITGLFELGETSWHETAFRTVTAALAKIARQPQKAA